VIYIRDKVCGLSPTLSLTFPVHCNGLNSIRATQMGLSRTLSQTSPHVEMVCVRDFHGLCPRLLPAVKFW